MRPQVKKKLRQLRRWRIRKKVSGTAARPRMAVKFTGEHIYVQFIDDVAGCTLASASSVVADAKGTKANVAGAKKLGAMAAVKAKEKNITEVVFDRGGFQFHGRVKALADAAREAGLKF